VPRALPWWCAVALAATTSLAGAQTLPLQTEEATTAGAGRLSFETAMDGIRDEPNFQTGKPRSRYDGPLLRFVYSPADNVEMDLEWVTMIRTPHDPDFGNVSDAGDVSLRSKVRFHDGGDRGPTVGARFTVTWAETAYGEGLGPNTLRSAVQLLLTQPAGPLRLHLNAGFGIDDQAEKPHVQSDFFVYGVAGEWRVAAPVALVAELAGRMGSGRPGTDEHRELRAGIRLGRGVVVGSAALRRGLGEADGKLGFTAGLGFRLSRSRAK
jgi:hypothetical protein